MDTNREYLGEKNGLRLFLLPDPDPPNPREYDNAGTMVTWHGKYDIGDEHPKTEPSIWYKTKTRERAEMLPLYLYAHGGLHISVSDFRDPWDSGQIGWIYILPEKGRSEWGRKWREKARQCMLAEVAEYNCYLAGEVYGYVVENERGDHMDSCFGFFGYQYAVEAAREALDVEVARKALDVVFGPISRPLTA